MFLLSGYSRMARGAEKTLPEVEIEKTLPEDEAEGSGLR